MSENGFSENKWTLLTIAMLVAATGILLATVIQKTGSDGPLGRRPKDGLPVGEIAPPIRAQGWINGDAPTPEELAGQVYVVDMWATYCYPCKMQAPHLIATYNQYKDRVRFIGLTAESPKGNPQLLREIDQFLTETGIEWTNGYGALEASIACKSNLIPEIWVIGRDGKVVWNHDSEGQLADGIELALNAPKPVAKPQSIKPTPAAAKEKALPAK